MRGVNEPAQPRIERSASTPQQVRVPEQNPVPFLVPPKNTQDIAAAPHWLSFIVRSHRYLEIVPAVRPTSNDFNFLNLAG